MVIEWQLLLPAACFARKDKTLIFASINSYWLARRCAVLLESGRFYRYIPIGGEVLCWVSGGRDPLAES